MQELAVWTAVKDSESLAELNAYLRAYPDGIFAEAARELVQELARRDVPREPVPSTSLKRV